MGTPWVELPRDTIRHTCGVTHMVSLTIPIATFHPTTHYRVWLLCHYLLLPLHFLSGERARVRLFSTFNLDDPSKSPLKGETLTVSTSPVRRGAWGEVFIHKQRTTIHEQRKTPPAKLNMTKEVVFTPIRFFYQPSTNNCQPLPFSDSKKTIPKSICGQKSKYIFCKKHNIRHIKTMALILFVLV